MAFLPDVRAALDAGQAIVALESSVLAQGLPVPANRRALELMTAAVTSAGATPAIAAVVKGRPQFGLEGEDLERFLRREGIAKVSARDLAVSIATGADGATTVAGTLALCASAGLRTFSTGGIGGVHRDRPYDESADLVELARTKAVVVCAGAKSILDLDATLERLDTLGVLVVGYRTNEMPGFFTPSTGVPLPHRVDSADEIATIWAAQQLLGRPGALLVMQPPPAGAALTSELVDEAVALAVRDARTARVRGGALTPFLLAAVERLTGGRSLETNLSLLEANASLAAHIAVAISTTAVNG